MCTPIVIDSPNIDLSNTPGPKDANGNPINGGQALPEDRVPVGGTTNATPTTQDNGTLVTASGGDPAGTAGTTAKTPDGSDGSTPTGSDIAGPKGSGLTGDPVADQNTALINSLTTLAHQFTDTTAGILQGQKDATAALTSGFLDLTKSQQDALKAADDLRKNTGQAARHPSYSLSMAKVQRANAGGAASTMLTGATGVPTNQLALGRQQLLGGAPA